MDIIDNLDSGRYMMNVDKQMANLNLASSHSGKLRPVITKKSIGSTSPNSLNTMKKLPAQPIQMSKTRSMPTSPEKTGAYKPKPASNANTLKKVRRIGF